LFLLILFIFDSTYSTYSTTFQLLGDTTGLATAGAVVQVKQVKSGKSLPVFAKGYRIQDDST
jgi:hypothetical protein